MDSQTTAQKDSGDDQELAKALAGVTDQLDSSDQSNTGLSFEETPTPSGAVIGSPFGTPAADDTASDSVLPEPMVVTPEPVADPAPTIATLHASNLHATPGGLDSIKQDALTELRPLVDKLNVSAEEKFDTYLLLLRSTDDDSLIAPAHEAAKDIKDEARRAQALLDIIKEIDYLSSDKQTA